MTLKVTPEVLNGLQSPGGSTALFTTPDCSGTTMFAQIALPLAKRYAMVLLEGGSCNPTISANHAWLWVTDALPPRAIPGAASCPLAVVRQ